MVLYGIVLAVHLFVSVVLIAVILLQAGKGGLAETMGGSTAQSILGTSAGTFLTRATETCAILFMVTCISLTILSSHRSGSLMLRRHGAAMPLPAPHAPVPTPAVPMTPASTPAPAATAPQQPTPAGTPSKK